jgi:hypothetical protein
MTDMEDIARLYADNYAISHAAGLAAVFNAGVEKGRADLMAELNPPAPQTEPAQTTSEQPAQ